MTILDDDTSPPEPSAREDCRKPFGCICPADEPCHFVALAQNMPVEREELEMPERG